MAGEGGTQARWPDPATVEAALHLVPGVIGASVAAGTDGRPVGLRMVLADDADEVDVAAAAHRILRREFGVGLDPAHIEVVEESEPEATVPPPRLHVVDDGSRHLLELGQELAPLLARLDRLDGMAPRFSAAVIDSASRHPSLAGGDEPAPLPAAEDPMPRLAFVHLGLAADGLGVVATVVLTRDGHDHVGTAEGSSLGSAVHRTVAVATADAIAVALGSGTRLDVEAVTVAPVGSVEVAVVLVDWVTADATQRLTGASEVRDDVRQAVIRATLDAVNRRLAPALEAR